MRDLFNLERQKLIKENNNLKEMIDYLQKKLAESYAEKWSLIRSYQLSDVRALEKEQNKP